MRELGLGGTGGALRPSQSVSRRTWLGDRLLLLRLRFEKGLAFSAKSS